jgi:hypothetical protein
VLRDRAIRLGRCGRADVQEGKVDKRVLAVLEYLSVSGLSPTVARVPCPPRGAAAGAANAAANKSIVSIQLTAIAGTPLAGHEGPAGIADVTVRKLLMLQGTERPRRIVTAQQIPGASIVSHSLRAAGTIRVSFSRNLAGAAAAGATLGPSEWIKLISRLGEIPDPTVSRAPSAASIPDPKQSEGAAGGNH